MRSPVGPRIPRLLSATNAALFAGYVWHENLSHGVTVAVGAAATALVVLAAWCLRGHGRLASIVGQLQLSLFSVLLLFSSLQLLRWVPRLIPAPIGSLVEGAQTGVLRRRVVEYLPTSPYAKLKPSVTVKVPGYYGPPANFSYEWQTDRRGFKNLPGIAARETVPVVAVGDSYTEGLGVATAATWCSVLTRRGYPTYSLGVQGYAPSQMAGVLNLYGRQLRPRWVVVGYLGNVYQRERYFMGKEDILAERRLPSAIGRLVDADLQGDALEVRKQYKYVGTAVLIFSYRRWLRPPNEADLAHGVADWQNDARFMPESELVPDETIRLGLMQRYRAELLLAERWTGSRRALAETAEWSRTLSVFESIVQQARGLPAQVVFVMFRNRGGTYYEAATGRPLPSAYGEDVEAALLEEFCARHGAFFVDTKVRFQGAALRLDAGSPIDSYPYLRYDAHPSPRGHELIADELQEFFAAHQGQAPFPQLPL